MAINDFFATLLLKTEQKTWWSFMKTIQNYQNKKSDFVWFFCASENLKILHDNTQIFFYNYHINLK